MGRRYPDNRYPLGENFIIMSRARRANYDSELQTEIIKVIEDSTYDHETHFTTPPPFSDILEKGTC